MVTKFNLLQKKIELSQLDRLCGKYIQSLEDVPSFENQIQILLELY